MRISAIIGAVSAVVSLTAWTAVPRPDVAPGAVSPVLGYRTQADLCRSVDYLFTVSRVTTDKALHQGEGWSRSRYIEAVTRTARQYGPGSKPWNDYFGDASDAALRTQFSDRNNSNDHHFELARRYRKAGNADWRYELIRALKPAEADASDEKDGIRLSFVRKDVTGMSVYALCAAHAECPGSRTPSPEEMPYCDNNWWPKP